MISAFKLQIDNFMKSSTQFTRKTVYKLEEKINETFLKYDDLINVNRITCCQNNTDLEKKIMDYKLVNDDNIKSITEENNEINNKLNKLEKEDLKAIQEKIDFLKKKQGEFGGSYNRFNRTSNKNMNPKSIKMVKSANNIYEREEKIKNKKSDKKETNENSQKENNETKKINIETSESGTSTQINNDIKNLESKLQSFIKTEIINLSKNILKKRTQKEKPKEKENENENEKVDISKISSNDFKREEISKESDKQVIIKTDIELDKTNNLNNFVKIESPKRKSAIPIEFTKNLFEQYMQKKEEKNKIIKNKNKYILEKIKEFFIEESFDNINVEENLKIEKIKKRNTNASVPEIPLKFYETVLQKELVQKKEFNSTKILPFVSKLKKKEKEKEKIKHNLSLFGKFKNLQNKKILKTPIQKKPSILKQEPAQTDQKNLTQKILNKPKISLNYIDQNITKNIIEQKISPYSKQINHPLTIEVKKSNKKIQIKEDIIKTPKFKRNQHLSNFTITLQGVKKIDFQPLDKIISTGNNNAHNIPSPTIYMDFPRTRFQFNEKVIESLHPLYRNKKFSKYIRPYISALTNTYQTMLKNNEKKAISQKKVGLIGNKSENNLIKKRGLKLKNEKEIKLPEIIDEEVKKNIKHHSPDYTEKSKNLELKEIFSFSNIKNGIQDIYLNKENRFNLNNLHEEARFINLKKKI